MDKAAAANPTLRVLFADHDRIWQTFRYVYPVVSRRAGGISVGINLNPDKICNFDCIYCSVNREKKPVTLEVDEQLLMQELGEMLRLVSTQKIFEHADFSHLPPAWRRVNDIAFSGDGEPTSHPRFHAVMQRVAEMKRQFGLDNVKIVLITNATLLHRPQVREALAVMDASNGEVWAKLDAGTDDYYQLVDRTAVPLRRVLENLLDCARTRATVIQSLFMKIHGRPPPAAEVDAYCDRLLEIGQGGGRIKLVQVYTVARWTTERFVDLLSDSELDALAAQIRTRLPGLPVEVYYGVPVQR